MSHIVVRCMLRVVCCSSTLRDCLLLGVVVVCCALGVDCCLLFIV